MGHVTVDDLASSIESLSDRERAKLMQRVGRARFCGPLDAFHRVVYEAADEDKSQLDLPVLEVVFNLKCRQLLFRSLERLLAFERVENGGFDACWRRLTKIFGKRITQSEVERMILSDFVLDLSDGLVDFLPSVSIQGINKFALKLTHRRSDFAPAAPEAFLAELDKIADSNRGSLRSNTSRLDSAVKFAGTMLSFRLRAMVIQLLAESLVAAFRQPSAQLINEVEDALSALAKSFAIEKRAGGRKSLRDSADSDAFRSELLETYRSETKRRRRRPTQEQVATAMNMRTSALRTRRRAFTIPWPPA